MTPEARRALLERVEELRSRVEGAWDNEPAPVYSQAWVDKRRLLFAERALGLLETVLGPESLDARTFAEDVQALVYQGRELAPGMGLDQAADAILETLARGSDVPGH